jgi:hypothetical protein
MKKILILAASFVGAVGAFAQGTVIFADNSASTGGALQIDVYAPQLASPGTETTGNSSSDIPSGSTVYTGGLIGGNTTATGSTGYGNGANFSAELYGAAGSTVQPFSALSPVSQYSSTFFTVTAGAGLFKAVSPAGDPGIAGSSAGSATLALAAWYNGGGTITSLSAAEAAHVPYGWSTPFVLSGLGNTGTPPATPPVLTGLTSFSLVTPVPEPGTITLGIMGAAAFLMRRRSK